MSLRVQSVNVPFVTAQVPGQRVPRLPGGSRVSRRDGFQWRRIVSWQWHTRNATRSLANGNRREASAEILDARALVQAVRHGFSRRSREAASRALNDLARQVRNGEVGAGELQGHFDRVLDVLNKRQTVAVADRMERAVRATKSADAMVELQLVAPKV